MPALTARQIAKAVTLVPWYAPDGLAFEREDIVADTRRGQVGPREPGRERGGTRNDAASVDEQRARVAVERLAGEDDGARRRDDNTPRILDRGRDRDRLGRAGEREPVVLEVRRLCGVEEVCAGRVEVEPRLAVGPVAVLPGEDAFPASSRESATAATPSDPASDGDVELVPLSLQAVAWRSAQRPSAQASSCRECVSLEVSTVMPPS